MLLEDTSVHHLHYVENLLDLTLARVLADQVLEILGGDTHLLDNLGFQSVERAAKILLLKLKTQIL